LACIVAARLIQLGFQHALAGLVSMQITSNPALASLHKLISTAVQLKSDPLDLPPRILDHRDQIFKVTGTFLPPGND
jgi:hypothetical protein